jgi:hypothetical protein
LHSDDSRYFHNHPWAFVTCILKGSYTDVGPIWRERLRVRSIRFRPKEWLHYVEVSKGGCWSLLVTGPKLQKWGFWVKGRIKRANKYFLEHGAHPCD